ncbi:SDR family oxidoreductase [Falsiroseomonas sp. HW251]|uniref:SDR family oxidoreductase n=1 Tax=Falsiroseomonas sp. HW251 TaxID=3390998 RepID=UPI003D313D28
MPAGQQGERLPPTRAARAAAGEPALDAFARARTPLCRRATPEDVADAALLLLSPGSDFGTGPVMVDGGLSVGM